eukprot:XP_001692727.1 predicted protein [Chlamydomonas reinhardtii]
MDFSVIHCQARPRQPRAPAHHLRMLTAFNLHPRLSAYAHPQPRPGPTSTPYTPC